MKSSSFALLAVFGLASAQLSQLPTCAQNCVTQYTSGSQIGGCSQLDAACICGNKNFISGIACCLASVCNAEDQQTAVTFAIQFCNTVGVQVPTAISCSSTLAASTTMMASTASVANNMSITATSPSTAAASSTATSTSKNSGSQGNAGTGAGVLGGILAALALL